MIDDDDIEGLAGEYVLGSLDPSERKAVDVRRARDAALDEAIRRWECRFGALSDRFPGIAPPPNLYRRILSRIPNAPPTPTVGWTTWRAQAQQPRVVAAAIALAACLLLALAWFAHLRTEAEPLLVAQLHGVGGTGDAAQVPAFAVVLDSSESTVTVRPIAVRPVLEKRYALWLIPQAGAAPIFLGAVSPIQPTTLTWAASRAMDAYAESSVVISLEPEGAAAGPSPAKPFAFTGRLVKASKPRP